MKPYGILLMAACAFAQENYSGWSHYRTYTLNNTADTSLGGTGITENVANFPLLLRLTPADSAIFSQASANGADIRFTDVTGTIRLKHHCEEWVAASRSAAFWILLPGVAGNTHTSFRMYWGRQGAADSSNSRAVFDTANGFAAVWHMNGTEDETDATPNGLLASSATSAVTAPTSIPGVVAKARLLDGSSQYFTLANSATGPLNFHMTDSYSFSAWVKVTAISATAKSGMAILNKGDNQWTFELYDDAATPKYWVVETRGNNTFLNARSHAALPPITANEGIGTWHYIAGTYRGGAAGSAIAETLYYDGNLAATMAGTNTNNTGRNENFNVFMGALPNNSSAPNGSSRSRFWNGAIDELRACKTSRSAAWIRLSYLTQKPGSSFLTAGPVQTVAIARVRHITGESARAGKRPRSLDGRSIKGRRPVLGSAGAIPIIPQ